TSATGYDLERRVGSGSWTRIASARTARTFTDAATLTDGASVAYRVRGVGAAGATTSWSELATITWSPVAPTFTVARTITSDWTNGYCASVLVTNTGTKALTWTITLSLADYPFNGTVTSISNAQTVSLVGASWTVEGDKKNAKIAPGKSVTWEYCAERPPPPAAQANVSVQVTNSWGTGYCATGTVTTTSQTPITWRVTMTPTMSPFAAEIPFPTSAPSGVSNATTISFEPNAWTLGGAGWNDIITAGQNHTFQWCGTIPAGG
ncbi:MAG: cellulose binding domain-containing protein, partial [Gaiellales bacterium]